MKSKIFIVIIIYSSVLFTGCSGDHSTKTVRDTNTNTYNVDTAKSARSTIDSSKVTKTTGDAGSLDNSASGGTKAVKDTVKVERKK